MLFRSDATRAYVRVEVNWADVPSAQYVGVDRVDAETGELTPLRPYVCYSGWCILTSCGQALFWDTEVPLDRAVFYRAHACPDYVSATDACLGDTLLTVDSSPQITIAAGGMFRLKDPVRPCNDLVVLLCAPDAGTTCDKEGVSFEEMDLEAYAANSFSLPVTNRPKPIPITRARRGVSSNLHLITHTFDDRDALLTLLAPGSLVLWQGPPEYGIPDRYMDVGQVGVARGLQDHRKQARKVSLPHTEADRPAGPTLGVCGNRVQDLCDVYATWGDMATAGLTWLSLLQGAASTPDPTDGLRTWADVAADFADWDAVDDGTRTWQGLLEGD